MQFKIIFFWRFLKQKIKNVKFLFCLKQYNYTTPHHKVRKIETLKMFISKLWARGGSSLTFSNPIHARALDSKLKLDRARPNMQSSLVDPNDLWLKRLNVLILSMVLVKKARSSFGNCGSIELKLLPYLLRA